MMLKVSIVALMSLLLSLCCASAQAKDGSSSSSGTGGPAGGVAVPFGSEAVLEVVSGAHAREVLYRDQLTLPVVIFAYDHLDLNSMRLAPVVGKAAEMLKGFAHVYAVDARNPSLHWLLDVLDVQVTPVLKLLAPRGQGRMQHDKSPLRHVGSGVRQAIDYNERDGYVPETIKKWALSQLPSNTIERIPSDKVKQQLVELTNSALQGEETKAPPISLLFTDKPVTSQLYKALSVAFNTRIRFLEVYKGDAPSLVKHFRVEKFPTLLLFQGKKDSNKRVHGPISYEGKLTVGDIGAFFAPYVLSDSDFSARKKKQDNRHVKKARSQVSTPMSPVKSIEEWHNDVLQRTKITGVFFTDPSAAESHKEHLSTINALLKSEKGQKATKGMKFVWVDKTKNEDIFKFFLGDGGDESSDLLIFVNPKKELMTRYVGALNQASILSFIQGKLAVGTGAKSLSLASIPPFSDASFDGEE